MDAVVEKSKGEFFGMNMSVAKKIIDTGGGADELMAYIVLARGVSKQNKSRISTHGAQSISKRTGMTYTKAEKAINSLCASEVISKPITKIDKATPDNRKTKWVVNDAGTDTNINLWLANAIADGLGNDEIKSPLERIYTDTPLGSSSRITEARLDTMMVLLTLYQHHELEAYGGVNPKIGLYREWKASENVVDREKTNIPDTNASLYEIAGSHEQVFIKFAEEALFYIENTTDRHNRFWSAFNNIKALGLVYEVTQIWSSNPSIDIKAEPLYTLYIHSESARKSEPYLQTEIHKTAFRFGVMDRYSEFANMEDNEDYSDIKSGRFRYIGHSIHGGYPIGIYRLKYRAKTSDTGKGIEAERMRVGHWEKILMNLY